MAKTGATRPRATRLRDVEPLFALLNAGCCGIPSPETPDEARAWLVGAGFAAAAADASTPARLKGLQALLGGVVEAFAAGEPVTDATLAALETALAGPAPPRRLRRVEGGYRLEAAPREATPVQVETTLVAAAAALLVEGEPALVRRCAGCRCRFYDASRGRTRRWCSMRGCGNRAKAASFYRRGREGGEGSG